MIARTLMVFLLVPTLIDPIPIDARQGPAALPSQNELIERRILSHLEYLFHKLIAERRDTTLDGTKAFSGGDRFLPGKIALGLSLVLIGSSGCRRMFASRF
jgi:hypothetical protein